MDDFAKLNKLASDTTNEMLKTSKFSRWFFKVITCRNPLYVFTFPIFLATTLSIGWFIGEVSAPACIAFMIGMFGTYVAMPFTLPSILAKGKGKLGTVATLYPVYATLKECANKLERFERKIVKAQACGDKKKEYKNYWNKAKYLTYTMQYLEDKFNKVEKKRDSSRSTKQADRIDRLETFISSAKYDVKKMFDKCIDDISILNSGLSINQDKGQPSIEQKQEENLLTVSSILHKDFGCDKQKNLVLNKKLNRQSCCNKNDGMSL